MPALGAKRRPRIGPGRLSAEQAAELPDRLLDAAWIQFTEHGFAGASMDQIAKRAGASTKTLYSRFDSKSDILEAVIRRNVQRALADHVRNMTLSPGTTEPREFLTTFAMQVGLANMAEEIAGLVRLTIAEAHRFPVYAKMYHDVTGLGVRAIARGLRVWRDKGLIEFDADPDDLAMLAFGMLTHQIRIRAVLGNPMTRTELQRHVTLGVDVFLRGITPDRSSRKRK
jgi:AcrR family transcriptional regulator